MRVLALVIALRRFVDRRQRARDAACCTSGSSRSISTRRRIRRRARRQSDAWTYNDLEMMRPYVESARRRADRDQPASRHAATAAQRHGSRGDRRSCTQRSPRARRFRHLPQARGNPAYRHGAARVAARWSVPPPTVARAAAAWRRDEAEPAVDVQEPRRPRRAFRAGEPALGLRHGHARLAARRSRARDPMVAQWYRTIGAYFAQRARVRRRARGISSAPDRRCRTIRVVLYGEACLQETLGAPRIQNYVRVTTLPNGLVILRRRSRRRRICGAPRRCCSARSPRVRRFAEARLRLGRVLIAAATA